MLEGGLLSFASKLLGPSGDSVDAPAEILSDLHVSQVNRRVHNEDVEDLSLSIAYVR